jgi:capsular exopolysaccharide synthesis family protein
MSRVQPLLRRLGLSPAAPPRRLEEEDAVQRAAAALSGKISFANETRSSLLSVAVTTRDPELSAKIANEVARQYLDFKREEKFAVMQRAHDWFQEQMVSLGKQVRADDLAVARYRKEHRLDEEAPNDGNDGQITRPATINRQQLEAISRELVEVSRERTLKEGELTQAQLALHGHASTQALPAVLVSPVVGQLLAESATAVAHEAELATTQGNRNPELTAVRAQIQKLQRRTEREMANVAGSLQVEVNAARSQEAALQQRLEDLRKAVSGENSAEVGLLALRTNARATRNIYESFLSRATQLANVAGIQEPDASLVGRARPPLTPSSPQTGRMLFVSAILSLGLGIAVACGIERLRTGFSLPEQLEIGLGVQLIGLVPNVPGRSLLRRRRSRASAAFSASLDRLRGQMRTLGEERPRTVMVTSALPKEGKSVFAAGLARNMAAAGWRVLLLECDFCCPSLAREFGMDSGPGLCDILSGHLLGKLKDVVREPEPRLHVITAGTKKGDPQELLASNRMNHLLLAVRENYDLVILDTPPVLPVADALVLARHADATLMVVRWEKTARAAVRDAIRLLQDSRAQILGAVMTRVDLRTASRSGGRMAYAFTRYDGYHVVRT